MIHIKQQWFSLIFVITTLMSHSAYPQDQSNGAPAPASSAEAQPTPTLSPVDWTSMNSGDKITIENASKTSLVLFVSVSTMNNPNAPGVTIQNCGSSSHISAGSSVICPLKGVVTFNSDGGRIAYGTYQIMKP